MDGIIANAPTFRVESRDGEKRAEYDFSKAIQEHLALVGFSMEVAVGFLVISFSKISAAELTCFSFFERSRSRRETQTILERLP